MEYVDRNDIKKEALPGRMIQKAVGAGAAIESGKMTVGYARYSAETGPMEPHQHAEETICVLHSDRGRVRYGPAKDDLPHSVDLATGMILHFPEMEWHVFEYDEGGYVDIAYIYGQVDNIRPEEKDR